MYILYVHTYTYICVLFTICMYACMHVCMYACMYVYIYIYIYVLSSSSSNCSIRVVRACPLVEIRQAVPCRAMRGNRVSVNSTLPPSYCCFMPCSHLRMRRVETCFARRRLPHEHLYMCTSVAALNFAVTCRCLFKTHSSGEEDTWENMFSEQQRRGNRSFFMHAHIHTHTHTHTHTHAYRHIHTYA